jgi:hypothetical protein
MLFVDSQDSNLLSLQLNYRSTLSTPDNATILNLLAFQLDKDGKMSPLQCSSVGVPYSDGKAADFKGPNMSPVTLQCSRSVCNSVHVIVQADRQITPSAQLDVSGIPDFKAGCKPPPIAGCAMYDPSGKMCVRCEFKIDAPGAQSAWKESICPSMPQDQLVNAEFKVTYNVANRGNGSDCWLTDSVKGADGNQIAKSDHTNVASCSVDVTRSTGFVKPQFPGHGLAGFEIDRCQWGGNPNMQCNLSGTVAIFVPQGQK